jgi:hypothetical protein
MCRRNRKTLNTFPSFIVLINMASKQKTKVVIGIGVQLFQRPPNYEVDSNFKFNPETEPELAEEITKKVAYAAGYFDVKFVRQYFENDKDNMKNGLHYSEMIILSEDSYEETVKKIKLATTKLVSSNYEAFFDYDDHKEQLEYLQERREKEAKREHEQWKREQERLKQSIPQ